MMENFEKVAKDCGTRVIPNSCVQEHCYLELQPYGKASLLAIGYMLVGEKGYEWDGGVVRVEGMDEDDPEYRHIRLVSIMPSHGTHNINIYQGGKLEITFAF